jgi:DNA polymerase
LEALSSALRGCVAAGRGKRFGSIDFSQIEARVLPWLAGDTNALDVFVEGKDVYVVAASGIYKVNEASVDGDKRQVGKVSVLALGYGGGVGAFQTMAKNYGLIIPDAQADEIKTAWREANPKIVGFWYDLDRAAIKAVKSPGELTHAGPHISFKMVGDNLLMKLPSGRFLFYRDAEIGESKFGGECVAYMGINQFTRAWCREDTYGGKWAENATQAVARDVMAEAMLRSRTIPGLDILGTVHDELLFEFDKHTSYQALYRVMNRAPLWAQGLPVAAEGYVGDRFKKG